MLLLSESIVVYSNHNMNQYKIEKRISDGAFGTVYKALNL